MTPAPMYCPFTELKTTDLPSEADSIDYFITFNGKNMGLSLSSSYDWESSDLVKNNLTAIRGDIFNGKWPMRNYIDESELQRLISLSDGPKTPKEKLDNLFLAVFKMQEKDGQEMVVNKIVAERSFWGGLYFKDVDECNFYFKALDDHGLIDGKFNQSGFTIALTITFKGLNYQIQLTESGITSNNCFIAMSFSENMTDIRDAIKTAIVETGFQPILIDEVHIESEKTINDEIIANIKKSKFCISDFTEQKDGVYFEAGFALGRGLKVIYTCKEDWFGKTHFDTNHFPHIIYKDPTDLTQKLKSKIEAWIK